MPKLVPIVLALVVVPSGNASADPLPPEQLAACKPDFDKYCGGQMPSARIVGIGCFMNGPVSDSCKKALDDFDKKRREGTPGTKN